MSVKVKICGVRTPAIVEEAADAGADFVGLVLFAKSPRHIELEEARVLAAVARGRIGTVAVMVDPEDDLVDGVLEKVRPVSFSSTAARAQSGSQPSKRAPACP